LEGFVGSQGRVLGGGGGGAVSMQISAEKKNTEREQRLVGKSGNEWMYGA